MFRARLFPLLLLVYCAVASNASAGMIASSIADFSGVQGQGNWSYGFFNQGAPPSLASYSVAGFTEFDLFDNASQRWKADPLQVGDATSGAPNSQFLNLDALGGHPTGIGPSGQNSIIWAVRRYESQVSELIDIEFDLRKINVGEPRGGGITGRIFVDGNEIFSQFIANDDDTQVLRTITRFVNAGSVIDFAIDPTGMMPATGPDGIFSARADGSRFSAVISTSSAVPEPSSLAVFAVLGLALVRKRRRSRIS